MRACVGRFSKRLRDDKKKRDGAEGRAESAVVILYYCCYILFLRYYFRAEVVLFRFEVGRYWKITLVFPSYYACVSVNCKCI